MPVESAVQRGSPPRDAVFKEQVGLAGDRQIVDGFAEAQGRRHPRVGPGVDGHPFEPGTLLCGRGPRAASANLLNVSLSRARGKLILIADLEYVRTRAKDRTECFRFLLRQAAADLS